MEAIKENLITIVLIFIIIIVSIAFGIFMYNIAIRNFNTNDFKVQEISDLNEGINENVIVEPEIEEINNSTNPEEGQSNEIVLTEIANIFNNCKSTQEMIERGYTMEAYASENDITIVSSGDGLVFYVQFVLNDNILSSEIEYIDLNSGLTAIKSMLAVKLVDCVGQTKGFADGELLNSLGNEEAMNYTIENEGVEIKQLADNKGMSIKVDLNSNFSFLNLY